MSILSIKYKQIFHGKSKRFSDRSQSLLNPWVKKFPLLIPLLERNPRLGGGLNDLSPSASELSTPSRFLTQRTVEHPRKKKKKKKERRRVKTVYTCPEQFERKRRIPRECYLRTLLKQIVQLHKMGAVDPWNQSFRPSLNCFTHSNGWFRKEEERKRKEASVWLARVEWKGERGWNGVTSGELRVRIPI